MRRRRGGGPATWARWSMARASASTLDGFARSQGAWIVSITPPPGHYEPGAVGLHRRSERSDRRAVSDRTAAWRTRRTKNRAGRRATGTLKTKSSRRPGVPLPSLRREAIPDPRSSARNDRETDDARPQAPDAPASRHLRAALAEAALSDAAAGAARGRARPRRADPAAPVRRRGRAAARLSRDGVREGATLSRPASPRGPSPPLLLPALPGDGLGGHLRPVRALSRLLQLARRSRRQAQGGGRRWRAR